MLIIGTFLFSKLYWPFEANGVMWYDWWCFFLGFFQIRCDSIWYQTHTLWLTLTHSHSIDSIWNWSQIKIEHYFIHSRLLSFRLVCIFFRLMSWFYKYFSTIYFNSNSFGFLSLFVKRTNTLQPKDLETTCAEFELWVI